MEDLGPEMEELGLAPDLSRLPERIRDLVKRGNRGEYGSRSEADWAACVGMFRAGYGVDEVWMVMTDPSHGISEKFFEKGSQGEAYLELTVDKAHRFAMSGEGRRITTYAHRRKGISID
jgi:hypothetical protein